MVDEAVKTHSLDTALVRSGAVFQRLDEEWVVIGHSDDKCEAIAERRYRVLEFMAETPALSIAGLRAKAVAAKAELLLAGPEGMLTTTGFSLLWSLVTDLLTMID